MKLLCGCAAAAAALLDTGRVAAVALGGSGIEQWPRAVRRPARPHDEEAEQPWEVQREVEKTVARLRHLRASSGDESDTRSIARELEHVESSLAARKPLQALDSEIGAVRATLCVEQGLSDADCEGFMRRACASVGDVAKQAPLQATPVTADMCQHFFLENRTLNDDVMSNSNSVVSVDASRRSATKLRRKTKTGAAAEPEQNKTEAAAEPKENATSEASAEGGNESVFGGKVERPLPSQGFNELSEGQLVEHDDNSTFTADWGREFGEGSGHRDVYAICREHPDNEWCRIHTYHEPPPHGGGCNSNGYPRLLLLATVVAGAVGAALF